MGMKPRFCVEGNISVVRAGAFSEKVWIWALFVSHPFRGKKRNGWGTEDYGANKNPQEVREPPISGSAAVMASAAVAAAAMMAAA